MNRPTSPALAVSRLSKTFAGVRVLHGVSLEIEPGEVHGLVGQNGSGKSTVIKILAGYHAPDPGGGMSIHGEDIPLPLTPGQARRHGLAFLHQDLGLVEGMSVLDNFLVGGRPLTGRGWRIRWNAERRRVRELLERFSVRLDPHTKVRDLSEAERAIVAIIRALDQLEASGVPHPILVLDEPTSHLPGAGVERLFEVIRAAVRHGASVLFVSHRLAEVRGITDRVSVLRDGYLIDTVATDAVDDRLLVRLILGRELEAPAAASAPSRTSDEPVFSVRGLRGRLVRDVSFDVHAGEILGLAGLVGMGQDEVLHLMCGSSRPVAGDIVLAGRSLRKASPRAAMRRGLVLLPANRQTHGSVPAATVRENVSLPVIGRYFSGGRLRHRRERRDVEQLLQSFDVRPPEPERRFATLSGGNQQKALLAKWLQVQPRVLALHEPTQGVDVGARQQLYGYIRDAAKSGGAVIVSSAEFEHLAHLCSRVLVFGHGRIVCELTGEVTEREIARQAFLVGANSDNEHEDSTLEGQR